MIVIKALLNIVIIFSCIIVALIIADAITGLKIKWLDDITDYMITVYLLVAGVFIVVSFIAAVVLTFQATCT